MKKLKKIAPVTLQEQLKDELSKRIENGTYKPGDKIPTEFELSEMYNVSRVTVRAAIQQLVDEDKLIKKAGKGTFVKQIPYTEIIHKGGSFTENCLERNAKPSTKIVSSKIIKCPEGFEDLSNKNNQVIEIIRIRSVDGEPCIVEVDYFPTSYDFLMQNKEKNLSFLKEITKVKGVVAAEFVDKFSVVYASKSFSKYLDCPIRTPLLKVSQTVKSIDNQVIYKNDQYILSSKYIYVKSSR